MLVKEGLAVDLSGVDEDTLLSPGTVLGELDEDTQALYRQVRALRGGSALLRLLYRRANALLMSEDIAYHLNLPKALTDADLAKLLELGWIRRLDRAGYSWFALDPDPRRREIVGRLVAWQDRWFEHLDAVRHIVNGAAAPA